MFHNIKADIIYYKTPTDFELEFNLCGCCRMRLLSDKMQDKKSFVHSLARDVSRSNVIIVAGPLFGDEGTVQIVADAIDTTTEIADNQAYGICSDEDIKILKNSIPLVTGEGYFGGCIIESGPQTLILLTDNKSIRKTIMQTLIHPYISELYSHEEKPQEDNMDIIIEPDTQDVEEVQEMEQTEDIHLITDIDDFEEDVEIETESEQTQADFQNDIILDDGIEEDDEEQPQIEEDEDIELFFEPAKTVRRNIGIYPKKYVSNYDYDYDDEEEDYYRPAVPNKNILSLSVLIISIVMLLVVAILCLCIFFIPAQSGVSPVANLQEIFNTMFG